MADEDSSPSPDPRDERFLFSGLPLKSPAEELAAVVERRVCVHLNLGEKESADRLRAAHELARAKLESVLAQPRIRIGS